MRTLSKTSLCSSIALATALVVGAKPASAQVVGNLNNAGGASISGGGSSIILNNPQTTIDWAATGTPTAGVRDFLPSGNIMAFSGQSDFAVLNRVTSGTDMIGLNGIITSTINGTKGGTVFFYNPNGIVVGGNASIDVGSLGLTTSDPSPASNPLNWFNDFNGSAPTLTFGGVTNGNSQISIQPGASILSNGSNSFIAMVAPKITTSGTIRTDGDVALVAAEAATLSFSSNYDLYSIQVDIGTGVSDSLSVTGGAIGRNSATETSGVARNAYLVTVPKNDATTLLIAGGASLGFDVANSAVVEGNSIVLSAGRDTAYSANQPGGVVRIGQSTYLSNVDASATDSVTVAPTAGSTHFLADAAFNALNAITVDASAGDVLFDGSLDADVSHYGSTGIGAVGGTVSLLAGNGHSLAVAGDADLYANGTGGYSFDDGVNGANGTGGQVSVKANGGQIRVGGLYASADGYGGVAGANAAGGSGQGGTVDVAALGGGAITAGNVALSAAGEGGSTVECYSCGISGGEGRGGTVNIGAADSNSALTFGSTYASAYGWGGAGDVTAGNGLGGNVLVDLAGLATVDLGQSAYLTAYGEGGYGLTDAVGGNGTGGLARLTMTGAAVDRPSLSAGYLSLDASGDGGTSMNGNDGGIGQGGQARAAIDGGDFTAGYANISAIGRGGYSWNRRAGNSNGGDAGMILNAASVNLVGALRIDGSAAAPSSEGAPAFGNVSTGGSARLDAVNSTIRTNLSGQNAYQSLWVGATADGGGANSGNGGAAYGGTVNSTISGSSIVGGDIALMAGAAGGYGDGGSGGFAQGGTLNLSLTNTQLTAPSLVLDTGGVGGSGTRGGGAAAGGSLGVGGNGATLTLANQLLVNANGEGGAATEDGGRGGDGQGGSIGIALANSSVTTDGLEVDAEGFGGDIVGNAAAGNGKGGSATVQLLGGSAVSATYMDLYAGGYGGENSRECASCSTLGGNGTGGASRLTLLGGGNSVNVQDIFWLYGSGIGGVGDNGGGDAVGNLASLDINDNSSLTFGQVYIFADGVGGEAFGAGHGGDGTAGLAQVASTGAAGAQIRHNGPFAFHVTAEGYGGDAENGDGGSGVSGTANYLADGLAFDSATGLYVSALALGGNSLAGAGGAASGGGAFVQLTNGASVTLASTLEARSRATGGSGASGGAASAGYIDVKVDNSSLVSGTGLAPDALGVILSGFAIGGAGSAGDGGDAVAVGAQLRALNGGTVRSTSAHITTYAQGGDSVAGLRAGNADAGESAIEAANGGDIGLTGFANVKADALGGTGSGGADGGTASADAFSDVRALGGRIAIAGDLNMTVNRTGGDGRNGGDALAIINYQTPTVGETFPVAEILAQGGSVAVGGLTTMTADSIGGHAAAGGRGGDAYGGTVSLRALNGATQPSTIALGDVAMSATATAGNGGAGLSSDVGDGGDGGDGGDALGGMLFVQAMSLNGQISAGNLQLTTDATAGNGGDGGTGVNGGNGGKGGTVATNWSAGAVNISLPSGGNPPGLPPVTNGFIHVGDIAASTHALGGNGGWAGVATNGIDGIAGDGGYAQSGDFYMYNRGGDLAVGNLDYRFDATGGTAGANTDGSAAGTGGNGSIGELILINTARSGQPDQRGTVSIGNLTAVGTSTGGGGLVSGGSLYTSSIDFETINADTRLGSLTYLANASGGPAISGYDLTSLIAVQNGSVAIDGALNIAVPDAMAIWLDNGTLTAATIDLAAGNFVHSPGAAPVTPGTVSAGAIRIASGGDIVVDANLDVTGGDLDLGAPGSVAIGSATASGSIAIFADSGTIVSNALSAAGDIVLAAAGNVATQALAAGGDLTIQGIAVTIAGTASAGGNLGVYASGPLSTGALQAGNDIELFGNGIAVAGPTSAGGTVNMTSAQSLVAGNIASAGNLVLTALAGDVTAGTLTSDSGVIDVLAGNALSIAGANAGSDLYLTALAGDLDIAGNSVAGGGIELDAGGTARAANLTAASTISVVGGAIAVGNLSTGVDIGLWSGGTLTAGTLSAAARVGVAAPGAITTGAINAGDIVMLLGGDGITTGPVTTNGELYIGNYGMFALGYDPLTEDFDPAPVLALAPQAAGGDVTIGGGVAASQVRAAAGGNWSSGAIAASSGPVTLSAGGAVTSGGVSGSQVAITSGGATTLAGALSAASSIRIDAGGNVALTSASGPAGIVVNSGGGISSSGAIAASSGPVTLSAGGAVTSGGVSGSQVAITSGGATTLAGALSAASSIRIDAGGNVALTSANGPAGIVVSSGGGISSSGALQTAAVLTLTAVGNIALQSVLAGGHFTIAGNAVSIGALNAPFGSIRAAGLLTVGDAWNVGQLDAQSDDISILPGASINGSYAELTSTNAAGAGIGDNSGAAAGSYLLDNAELARVHSTTTVVRARVNAAPINLMIGTTALDGGGRTYDFGVADAAGRVAGRLRVTGPVSGQNFGAADALILDARLMEVDAVNGAIDFSPNSDAAVGTLSFNGERVHVAEASVLDRLAADPAYANRAIDLATAPTAPHRGTTINAGTINVGLFQTGAAPAALPYTIYVQNMGSSAVRSGLLISDANLTTDRGAGSVEMVLNGTLVDPISGQTLSGTAARDAFVADTDNDLTLYTSASSINGCALAGCFTPLPPAPPPAAIGDLASQFVFLDTNVGDMLTFDAATLFEAGADAGATTADEEQDSDQSDDENALEAPASLINGRPLDPQTATDEPVSGGGNPALIGAGATQEEQK